MHQRAANIQTNVPDCNDCHNDEKHTNTNKYMFKFNLNKKRNRKSLFLCLHFLHIYYDVICLCLFMVFLFCFQLLYEFLLMLFYSAIFAARGIQLNKKFVGSCDCGQKVKRICNFLIRQKSYTYIYKPIKNRLYAVKWKLFEILSSCTYFGPTLDFCFGSFSSPMYALSILCE